MGGVRLWEVSVSGGSTVSIFIYVYCKSCVKEDTK